MKVSIHANTTRYTDVPCPFCSLLCDDLVIENNGVSITANKNACSKASKEFERPMRINSPQINGQAVSLDQAIAQAAKLLKTSQNPLFGGLGTDVDGMRAVMDIADQTGGIIEHMHGESAANNFRVLQDIGWINTTLMEVKNRADVIILAGTNTNAFPRFFERVIMNKKSLFEQNLQDREVIYLGSRATAPELNTINGKKIRQLNFKTSRIVEILAALRAVLRNNNLQVKKIAGVSIKDLRSLAQTMRAARYGVVVWSPGDLNWPHADLAIRSICELVKELNLTTRFAGLPLGGNEGGMSAASVCAWQSGYPLRVSYAAGHPQYNPLYSTKDLLSNNEIDSLVWVSSIGANNPPPQATVPIIALTTPHTVFPQTPAVYIPIGTPGIDHSGRMIRCDSVVSHRLAQLRKSDLPDLATVLGTIQKSI